MYATQVISPNALSQVIPGDKSTDDIANSVQFPEPPCSDDITNLNYTGDPNCCEENTDSLPLPEQYVSDDNIDSTQMQGQNYFIGLENPLQQMEQNYPDEDKISFPIPEQTCSEDNLNSFKLPELQCSEDDSNSFKSQEMNGDDVPSSHLPELPCSEDDKQSLPMPEQHCSDQFLNSPQFSNLNSSANYSNAFQSPEPYCSAEPIQPIQLLNTNGYDQTASFSQLTCQQYANDVPTTSHNIPPSLKVDDITSCPMTGEHVWANSITETPMHNPDQVAHPFSPHYTSAQQESGKENTGSDSNAILTERSLEFESTSFLPVSLPVLSDLPGFDNLDKVYDTPLASMNEDNYQQPFYGASPEDSILSSSTWYTPPQSPPCDRLTSEPVINAIDPPLQLPPDSLYVNGSILGTSTQMLIDTGASVSAVSSTFFSTFSSCPLLQPSNLPNIRTVSGEELSVTGKASLTLTLAGVSYSFHFLVIENLTYPVVIGRDFLMHYGSVIDMKAKSLTLSGNLPIPLHQSSVFQNSATQSSETITVHSNATYILPPLSESVIPVYSSTTLLEGSTGLIEPTPRLTERYHICGATQLVSLSDKHTFPFRVLNPTNKPVTIYRCTTMGTFISSGGSISVITTPEEQQSSQTSADSQHTVPLDFTGSTLTEEQKTQLRSLVSEYQDIFALSSDELGRTGLVRHRIETGDSPPIKQRPYRVSEAQRGIIEEHVADMLNRGIIQPSVSPWSSPIILVKKKDGTDRFVIDFRRLNSVTRKDSYPLPRIDDALDALNGTKFFSSMDLMSGYWQVEMEPESREYTAFTTHGGL